MGAGLRIPRHSLSHQAAGPQLGLLNQQLLWKGGRGRAPSRAASLTGSQPGPLTLDPRVAFLNSFKVDYIQ